MQLSKVKFILLVLCFLVLGGIVGALLQKKVTIALGGISSEAKAALADQALDRNDLVHAEALSYEAIGLDPESYRPYQTLGGVFSRRGEVAAAIGAYSRAIDELNGPGGHFRLLKLDQSLRQSDLVLLRARIAKLKEKT